LGDPGAGKSTFARKLLGLQAAVLLGECPAMPQIAPELLPVLIILRELAPRLQSLDLENGSAESRKRALLQVVSDYLQAGLGQVNAAGFATGLQAALERGAVLLVLDGLDEVPQDLRRRVRQVVSALIGEYRLERLIITSRIRSYTGEAVFPNLPAFTLRGFDKEQINRFVNAWYQARVESGHLRPNDKDRQVQDLVKAATSPDLREIASNPMMLTSMALIHQKEVGLPRERVRLYKLVVDVLIRRWQKYKLGEKGMAPSEALAAFLKDENRLLAALERLAYEAHQANKDQHAVADLPRKEALAILEAKEYLGHPGPAAEFLDYVDQRAGLLKGNGGELEKPTSYSFPHRTFQEYLAGCYLVRERSRSMARLYHQCAAEGDAWSVAAQLGAEELYYNRRSLHSMLDLAYQLCPTGQPGNLQQQRAALWSGNMARLAGPDEIGQDGDSPNGGPAYLERLRQALAAVLAGDLPPIERAEAGRALARVGDHRTAILTVEDIEFCFIPAGPFQMGIPQGPGDSDEQPQHEVVLPDYWIMRYPITNAQFNNFVTAGGYLEPRFWVEAASAKVWLDGKVVRRFVPDESWTVDVAEECESHPHDFGESFNLPNLPVVGISWYEALAFARWLNERLQAYARRKATSAVIWQKLAAGEIHIILPSEDEWEKAARGGDERLYPWGNAFNTNLANTSSTGLDSTCVVGCFPNGASPYGVLDMSGNVWEWTRSNYKKYPYKSGDGREELSVGRSIYRMVRGGSWFNGPQHARCTSRFGYTPDIPVF
jgi:formylglycine-generating enzyme required for sulfatase activity